MRVGLAGITPWMAPADRFYRIDTALVVPQLDTGDWTLRIHGMVDQEVDLTWDDLLPQPMRAALVTLTCVSNEVGGDLIGNACWTGWPIRDLLAAGQAQAGADMVLSTQRRRLHRRHAARGARPTTATRCSRSP